MTRNEEIEKEAFNYINSDAVDPTHMQLAFGDFINGAKWGDKTMLDRACEWLKNNWREYVYQDKDGIVSFAHWESDFRKAMEEQRISRYENKTNRRYGKNVLRDWRHSTNQET